MTFQHFLLGKNTFVYKNTLLAHLEKNSQRPWTYVCTVHKCYICFQVVSTSTVDGLPTAPSEVSYSVRKGSIYYIVETNIGIDVLWNKENAVKVRLQPQHMGKVRLRSQAGFCCHKYLMVNSPIVYII